MFLKMELINIEQPNVFLNVKAHVKRLAEAFGFLGKWVKVATVPTIVSS